MHFHKLQTFLKIFCLNLQSPVWVSLHHRQSKMPTILGILGHVMLQCTLAKYGYGAATVGVPTFYTNIAQQAKSINISNLLWIAR